MLPGHDKGIDRAMSVFKASQEVGIVGVCTVVAHIRATKELGGCAAAEGISDPKIRNVCVS